MIRAVLAVAALVLLAGCDSLTDALAEFAKGEPPVTLVIHPGYQAKVGEKSVPIFGTDVCPSADRFMRALFGPDPDEGKNLCVVVEPHTQSVRVILGGGDSPALETWTVERDGSRTMFRRGDGSYVTEAM